MIMILDQNLKEVARRDQCSAVDVKGCSDV